LKKKNILNNFFYFNNNIILHIEKNYLNKIFINEFNKIILIVKDKNIFSELKTNLGLFNIKQYIKINIFFNIKQYNNKILYNNILQ
jgi:hypothetical protein